MCRDIIRYKDTVELDVFFILGLPLVLALFCLYRMAKFRLYATFNGYKCQRAK